MSSTARLSIADNVVFERLQDAVEQHRNTVENLRTLKASISTSARFAVDPQGELWFGNSSFCYPFWSRYLDVFDEVRLLARAWPCTKPPEGWQPATGRGVRGATFPDFHSPLRTAARLANTRQVIRATISEAPAVILRVPCPVGDIVHGVVRRLGHPFAVEVLSDPYDGFAPDASSLRLRALYRWWFTRSLRRQCERACAAAYVSAHSLQRRYPPPTGAFTTHFSSVLLSDDQVTPTPRTYNTPQGPVELIMVAALNNLQKGPQIVLHALAQCAREGLDVRVKIVGDGTHRSVVEQLACRLGLSDRSCFLGYVSSRQAVQEQLDGANLFVHPSFQDGVPRAMIEAMGRGLPCIGSTVGGIPELLPTEDMVEPGDADALAAKIREVVTDPERMTRMSERNLAKAGEYRDVVLRERRQQFYRAVNDSTHRWLRQQGGTR